MHPPYRLLALVTVVMTCAGACAASVEAGYTLTPDPVRVALTDYVTTNEIRGTEPMAADAADCVSTRIVSRIGREELARYGLTGPDDVESFFAASVVWPTELHEMFDRVTAGCTRREDVVAFGGTVGRTFASPIVTLTQGEEFCIGEMLVSFGLTGADVPTASRVTDLDATDDPDEQALLLVTAKLLDDCLGLGRSVLVAYRGTETLRPASVDCLNELETDSSYVDLVRLTTRLDDPEDDAAADGLLAFLGRCLTDAELVTVLELP